MVINYDISLVSGMYKLKDSLLFDDIKFQPSISSMILSLFHGALEATNISRALCIFRNKYCNHPL